MGKTCVAGGIGKREMMIRTNGIKTTGILLAALLFCALLLPVHGAVAEESGERGETVYITADANGNVQSIISSVYINNPGKAESITDYTDLTGIENILGSEPPEITGDKVTFLTEGEDVCYQGVSEKELPFSVEIEYYLNGKRMSSEDIAGKSGKLRMEIKTTNRLYEDVEVDGEIVTLYVPFTLIAMISLDETYANVTADGAKVSAQAGQISVMAVLFPGLEESLGLSQNDNINDSVTIEADVTEFELSGITLIGMTGIVDQNDLAGIDDVASLTEALNELNDASAELYKGARKLNKGMDAFIEGLGDYLNATGELSSAAAELASGATSLAEGNYSLAIGLMELHKGVKEMADGLFDAYDMIDDIFADGVPDSVVRSVRSSIEGALKIIVQDDVLGDVKNEARRQLNDLVKSGTITQEQADVIYQEVIASISAERIISNVDKALSNERMRQIADDIWKMIGSQAIVVSIKQMVGQLVSAVNELERGINQLYLGAGELSNGVAKFESGIIEYAEGMAEFAKSSDVLLEALATIGTGVDSITYGLKQLSQDGMQRIIDETSEIDVSLARKDALLELSASYTSFTATRENIDGSVQFLLTTEEIVMEREIIPEYENGKDNPDTIPQGEGEEANTETERNFFQRIGDWFAGIFESIKGWFS